MRDILKMNKRLYELAADASVEDAKLLMSTAVLLLDQEELLEALESLVESLAKQDDEGLIEHAQPMIAARLAIQRSRLKV